MHVFRVASCSYSCLDIHYQLETTNLFSWYEIPCLKISKFWIRRFIRKKIFENSYESGTKSVSCPNCQKILCNISLSSVQGCQNGSSGSRFCSNDELSMTLTSLPFLLGMSGLLSEQIVDVKVAENDIVCMLRCF